MNKAQIKQFVESWKKYSNRTIVIVDFANVEKWKESLGWKIGVRELSNLVKLFSSGNKELRRFYYGSDFGQYDSSTTLVSWSQTILDTAKYNGFTIETKRVKYIEDKVTGTVKRKCDLDVEMCVDLIKKRDDYDRIVLFSGDGDMACALEYLRSVYGKEAYVFGARDHTGKELIDAHKAGNISKIMFAEDFEYRISMKVRGH